MTLRDKTKEALKRVMKINEVQDHSIIIQLMGATSYLFAYPERASEEDREILKQAYIHLSEKGGI
jgi:hypothetical protein